MVTSQARDPKTGRFLPCTCGDKLRKCEAHAKNPFVSGRTIDKRTYDESWATLRALNDALDRAQDSLDRCLK